CGKLPLDRSGPDVDRVHGVVPAADVKVAVLDIHASQRFAGGCTQRVVKLGGFPELPLSLEVKRPNPIGSGPVQECPRYQRGLRRVRTESAEAVYDRATGRAHYQYVRSRDRHQPVAQCAQRLGSGQVTPRNLTAGAIEDDHSARKSAGELGGDHLAAHHGQAQIIGWPGIAALGQPLLPAGRAVGERVSTHAWVQRGWGATLAEKAPLGAIDVVTHRQVHGIGIDLEAVDEEIRPQRLIPYNRTSDRVEAQEADIRETGRLIEGT